MITIKEAEEILKKEYHIDNFKFLVGEILLSDYSEDIHEVAFDNSLFSSVTMLGESKKCEVSVFEVLLNQGYQNRRVGITQAMFRILRGLHINNAIVTFVNADKNNYRISLLTSKYEFDGDKIVRVISNPRRYSYSLGFGTKTKTAYKFLIEKGKVSSLDELISRFSVEVVNKQFYTEIATAFTELVGGERNGRKYEKLLDIYSVVDHNKYAEFGVRLIGRIMFCWFLREKQSENGVPLIPNDMLALDTVTAKTNYYHDVLEPLFFELLNTNQNRRKAEFQNDYFGKVPYLNGGLFNPQIDDHYKYDSLNHIGTYGIVQIPNYWFERFYTVLSEYNFTVDENTAYDIELSIDPEMLGRIFENLLAEINPETGENAKKSTGSFYTPRDIVDYMVDSSLCEYLKTKTDIDEIKLKALISYSKEDDELAIFDKPEKKKLIDALYTVTALDPACGSGAFPIGMLQKIVYILQELDPDATLWFDKATENVSILIKKEFEKKFNSGSLNYIRKLCVIQNSIFGIDIQPIAVEISRLRCFLSLIIEEKVQDNEENRGINPLPNLDFKFIIANSLLPLPYDKDSSANQTSLFENQEHMEHLKAVRDEYFNTNDYALKNELKLQFADIQKEMFQETLSRNKYASAKYSALSNWSPFKSEPTYWFDADWMFGIKDGFDIVIANPPYIDSETMTKTMPDLRKSYTKFFSVAKGNWDMFLLFIELGITLNKQNGICTMIVPNKLIAADYASETRNYISNYYLNTLRDYSNVTVFDNVAVYPIVFLIEKDSDDLCETSCVVMNSISSYEIETKVQWKNFKTEKNWDRFFNASPLQNSIINKVKCGKRLGEIATVRGAATVNEAYEIKKILTEKKAPAEDDKCFINTGTIDRYLTTWNSEKTQYIKNGYYCPVVDVNQLDSIYPTRAYEAKSEKIIIGGMTKVLECYYDNGKCLAGKSTTIVYDSQISLKYICAILNSKLLSWYYSVYYNSLSLAGGYFRIGAPQIKELPIIINPNYYTTISDLVDKQLQNYDISVDKEIDKAVYEIYNLSLEEIAAVEEST